MANPNKKPDVQVTSQVTEPVVALVEQPAVVGRQTEPEEMVAPRALRQPPTMVISDEPVVEVAPKVKLTAQTLREMEAGKASIS